MRQYLWKVEMDASPLQQLVVGVDVSQEDLGEGVGELRALLDHVAQVTRHLQVAALLRRAAAAGVTVQRLLQHRLDVEGGATCKYNHSGQLIIKTIKYKMHS